jgi:hypothetical protein
MLSQSRLKVALALALAATWLIVTTAINADEPPGFVQVLPEARLWREVRCGEVEEFHCGSYLPATGQRSAFSSNGTG